MSAKEKGGMIVSRTAKAYVAPGANVMAFSAKDDILGRGSVDAAMFSLFPGEEEEQIEFPEENN